MSVLLFTTAFYVFPSTIQTTVIHYRQTKVHCGTDTVLKSNVPFDFSTVSVPSVNVNKPNVSRLYLQRVLVSFRVIRRCHFCFAWLECLEGSAGTHCNKNKATHRAS